MNLILILTFTDFARFIEYVDFENIDLNVFAISIGSHVVRLIDSHTEFLW